MKTISYLFCACIWVVGLSACQGEQQHAQSEISRQEAVVENGGDPETVNTLVQQYLAYTTNYPEDSEANPRYLYRAAALQYRLNNYDAARNNLEKAIREYYDNENTPNSVLLLEDIYQDKLKDRMASSIIMQAAAESFPELANHQEKVASIQNSGLAPVAQRLDAVARAMYPDTTGRIDLRRANDFITGASVYALISPDGDQVPELLYKAAETARTVQAFTKTIELYDWLIDHYPDFEKVPQAMFLKGFTLDNDLRRLEEARAIYEDFLATYPQDDFADDARFLLDNLGKTDEEIIQSFDGTQAEQ
ncbi:tetratricopeptide repeat protein [Flavilitoribacter nigricans]|nr:tetratricopeptide repeat protein [Flavilitoribacter nigricans]